MLIFDAAVACLIFKIFGEQGLWALAITCMVTILRTARNINRFCKDIEQEAYAMITEEEDDE